MSIYTVEQVPHDPWEAHSLRGAYESQAEAEVAAWTLIQRDVAYWHQNFKEEWEGDSNAPVYRPELDPHIDRVVIKEWRDGVVAAEKLVTA